MVIIWPIFGLPKEIKTGNRNLQTNNTRHFYERSISLAITVSIVQ